MKSIMEEASSITKAIETAWNRAGQPQEFTIKILELPKTSFFGLKTAKSAKIAFFFTEAAPKPREAQSKTRPLHSRQPSRPPVAEGRTDQPSERPQPPQRRLLPQERSFQEGRPAARPEQQRRTPHQSPQPQRAEPRPYEPRSSESRESWTPEMVDAACDWVRETLVMMGKPDIKVNAHVSYNYLKINLDHPVLEDARQEDTQLKSWGNLAMEAVREKMRKPFRNLRVVLESRPSRCA